MSERSEHPRMSEYNEMFVKAKTNDEVGAFHERLKIRVPPEQIKDALDRLVTGDVSVLDEIYEFGDRSSDPIDIIRIWSYLIEKFGALGDLTPPRRKALLLMHKRIAPLVLDCFGVEPSGGA